MTREDGARADAGDGRVREIRVGSHAIVEPAARTVPLVFASPHSGQEYPPEFIAAARLGPLALRRSEDAFVDRLYAAAPILGAPLLKAHFPRVYVDPNRDAYELDASMFDGPVPNYVNTTSARVAAGLGTVARVVASGEAIYARRLSFEEVRQRIATHYFPYHHSLRTLLEQTHQRFGAYLLIDCHSMPSIGGPMDADPGLKRLDFVLGDCFGTTCPPFVTELAEDTLQGFGYSVKRNIPYAGGFTTRHYGRPHDGKHALQIEVNRALYMDEERIVPTEGLRAITAAATALIERLARIDPERLRR